MARATPALLALCAVLGLTVRAGAEDLLSVAPVTYARPSGTIFVPVFIQDVPGSSNGLDDAIRTISFRIEWSHLEWIEGCSLDPNPTCKVVFHEANVLLDNVDLDSKFTFVTRQSIEVFRVAAHPIDWTVDAALPADLIGSLEITIASDAPPGAEIDLTFDTTADATYLGDEGLGIVETVGNGLAGTCHEGETLTFTVTSSNEAFGACETASWTFDGEGPSQTGASVEHTFTAGTHQVALAVSTTGGTATLTETVTVVSACALPPVASGLGITFAGVTTQCDSSSTPCALGETIRFTPILDPEIASCALVLDVR